MATIVATLPSVTLAVTDAAVDGEPPLMVTEHQLRKFITVSVGVPLPPHAEPKQTTMTAQASARCRPHFAVANLTLVFI